MFKESVLFCVFYCYIWWRESLCILCVIFNCIDSIDNYSIFCICRSKSRSVDHGLAQPFANLDSLRSTVEGRFDSVERLSKGSCFDLKLYVRIFSYHSVYRFECGKHNFSSDGLKMEYFSYNNQSVQLMWPTVIIYSIIAMISSE